MAEVGFESALAFIGKVKEVYEAESSRYQGFLDALKDFKAGSADTRETTKRVLALFQGHPELIEGYATFMPPGNTIQVPADPQEHILVTMITGTMEVARDGTVISETQTGATEPQRTGTKFPELGDWDKCILENLRARIADSEEDKAKYEVFITSFEAYVKTPPEQRKAPLDAEFVEKLKELLGGDDEFKKVLSEISS